MKETKQHVAIIGAGIVGVSTAIWLQRAGCQVTLIERKEPAAGASHGNAGVLAAASIVPVPVPGLLKKAPGMLFNPNKPLFLRWSYLPALMPFLMKYLPHGRHSQVERISVSLAELLHDTAEQHVAVSRGTEAEKYLQTGDYLFAYENQAAYEADSYAWQIRRQRGFKFEVITADEMATYDPAMAERFGLAVRCPNHGHIKDPGAYVKALTRHVVEEGGDLVIGDVDDILISGNKACGVVTSTDRIEADHVVLAGGIWSIALTKKLGINVPMEAERGYHIEYVNPSIMPKVPIMVTSGKYVMTPMQGRLRCAGIVEFGGVSEKRSRAPIELLKRQTRELLPDLKYDRIDEWMGYRPSTADSLPLIGSLKGISNIWTGFGHQHIGLSGGPKTGRWLADMIAGKKLNIDLASFAPNRFDR